MKPDRSWALLGQCVCILLGTSTTTTTNDTTPTAIPTAEVSWRYLHTLCAKQSNGGTALARAMEGAASVYVSHTQFTQVLHIIDPVNYPPSSSSSPPSPSVAPTVLAFTHRVSQSLSRHGRWGRDRFSLGLATLTQWMQLVLTGKCVYVEVCR